MNNENNNMNNGQNVITTPVVPTTTPVVNNNAINQTVVPATTPVVQQPVQTPIVPTTTPVVNSVPMNQTIVPATTPVVPELLSPTPVVQQPVQTPVVPTTPVTVAPVAPQTDNNTMVNENLQKVEIKNYKGPSKFKVFVLLVFFIFLIAFIIFLPQISSYIRIYMSNTGNEEPIEEVITTGKLVCTLNANTTSLDKEYEFDFSFTDSKLKKTKYIAYTRGDSTTESALDELNEKCVALKESTSELEGVSIRCENFEGKFTETQTFELEVIDTEKLNAAFTEAGGIVPSYKYDQDIDDIEKNMKASLYTCERQK